MKRKLLLSIQLLCIAQLCFSQNIPEEARKHYLRGQAAVEMVANEADNLAAISEFNTAIALAPDWADPYYDLGLFQDKCGKFEEAIVNLKVFISLTDDNSKAREAQDLIYKIEIKAEKINEKQKTIETIVTSKLKIEGGKESGSCFISSFSSHGDDLKANIKCGLAPDFDQVVLVAYDGYNLKFSYTYYGCANAPGLKSYPCPWTVTIAGKVFSKTPLTFKVKETWVRNFNGAFSEEYDCVWTFTK